MMIGLCLGNNMKGFDMNEEDNDEDLDDKEEYNKRINKIK